MKKNTVHIIFVFVVGCLLGMAGFVFAAPLASVGPWDPSSYVLSQINEIRKAPYQNLIIRGYSPAFLQENNIFPNTVFPALRKDRILQDHANSEFSHERPFYADKSIPQKNHYMYAVNRSAVISFMNYMSLERACRIFISHTLGKEFQKGREKVLLSHKVGRVGILISSGTDVQGNSSWFFALHLAKGIAVHDMQMLNLINQIRAYPEQIPSFVKKETLLWVENTLYFPSLINRSYSPVFFSSGLYENLNRRDSLNPVNINSSDHFFQYDFSSFFSPSGKNTSIDERKRTSVSQCFSRLLEKEIFSSLQERVLFSNDFSSMAVTSQFFYDYSSIRQINIAARNHFYSNGLNGRSVFFERAGLYVLVFRDSNGDELYSPGEEIAGLPIEIYDSYHNLLHSLKTDRAGHVDVQLPSFRSYIFKIKYSPYHTVESQVFVSRDQFVSFIAPKSKGY